MAKNLIASREIQEEIGSDNPTKTKLGFGGLTCKITEEGVPDQKF